MSKELIESIIDRDFVSAEEHFKNRLDALKEQKIYEMKRQVAINMQEETSGRQRIQRDREALARGTAVRASVKYPEYTGVSSPEGAKDAYDAEQERTRPLKKVTTAGIAKATRAQKLARIGSAVERLTKRGHSDPGRHLARAVGKDIAKKTAPVVKGAKSVAGWILRDIGSSIGEETK